MNSTEETLSTCPHCKRKDVGSKAAGAALVRLPIRHPGRTASIDPIVGWETAMVCAPAEKTVHRPRCAALVQTYKHGKDCSSCAEVNRPGSEISHRRDDSMFTE